MRVAVLHSCVSHVAMSVIIMYLLLRMRIFDQSDHSYRMTVLQRFQPIIINCAIFRDFYYAKYGEKFEYILRNDYYLAK